jgi:type IV secretion system protein VirD4
MNGTRRQRQSTGYGSMQWATFADIQRVCGGALLSGDGVVLGQVDRHILRASHDLWAHTVLIGPSRTGKGVSSVVPTLLAYPHSVVVLDIKGEDYDLTSQHRLNQVIPDGQAVYRFNATATNGHAIDLLRFIRRGELPEVRDIQRLFDCLTTPEDASTEITEYWRGKATQTLETLTLYLPYQDRYPHTMGGLRRLMTSPAWPMATVLDAMGRCDPPDVSATIIELIREGVQAFRTVPFTKQQEVWDSAANYLSIWRDPSLEHNTRQQDIPWEHLQHGPAPITVYLQVTAEDLQGPLRSFFRTLISKIVWRQMEYPVNSRRWDCRFLVDEAGSLRYLPALESMVSQAAGYGLGSLLVFQSPNQLTRWYGAKNAILDNCGARVFYGPNDIDSAELYERYAGRSTVLEETHRLAGNRWHLTYNRDVSSTVMTHGRPLRMAEEFLGMEEDQCLIRVRGGCGPILATKLQYFTDPIFRTLAG